MLKGHILRAAILLLLLLQLAACGQRQGKPPVPMAQPVPARSKAIPFPPSANPSPARRVSASQLEVDGQDWVSQSGGGNSAGENPGAYAIRPGGEDDLAYAVYTVGGLTDDRPVGLSFEVVPAAINPGGEEDLPLSFWVGLSDYTEFHWEWFGPYDSPQSFNLNGAAILDRYISAGNSLSYVVICDPSQTPPGPGNPDGLCAAEVITSTTDTLAATDGAYESTKPHYAMFTSAKTGSKVASVLSSAQYVTLAWQHIVDPANGSANEAFIYQVFRKRLDEANAVPIGSVLAPAQQYIDPTNNVGGIPEILPGETYLYFLRAVNNAGFTPFASASAVAVPFLPPGNVQASDGQFTGKVVVTWLPSHSADEYRIYKDDDTAPPVATVGNVIQWEEFPGDLAIHTYWVEAFDSTRGVGSSLSQSDTGYASGIATPGNVQATDGSFTNQVHITWDKSTGANEYRIYRDDNTGPSVATVGDVAQWDDDPGDHSLHSYWVEGHDNITGVTSLLSLLDTGYENLLPVAIFTANPTEGDSPLSVDFDASLSSDIDGPGGMIQTYAWDFDGDTIVDFESPSPTVAHNFDYAGVYDTILTVTDDEASTGTVNNQITVHGWALVEVQTTSWFLYSSLAVVNGRPAMSYANNSSSGDLVFVRALDDDGQTWGAPQTLDSSGSCSDTSLTIINGKPAIGYVDDSLHDLKFVSSTDADGANWIAPLTIDGASDVEYYCSMKVVNGFPAITYNENNIDRIKFVRAADADGSAWATPVVVAPTGDGYNSLEIVNGFPAISYDLGNLMFVRASDADGSAWGTPIIAASGTDIGHDNSLAVVNGFPAICSYDASNGLNYVRATDMNGDNWGTPLILDNAGGQWTSLAVIDGVPAISFVVMGGDSNPDLKYVLSTDANGSSWNLPITIDTTAFSTNTSLLLVNSHPSISYEGFALPAPPSNYAFLF